MESRIDKGKGSVSTVLITNGSLRNGDFFVSGNTWGKIRAMINDKGQKIDIAGPATPVEILGMNSSAFAGAEFLVTKDENEAKELSEYKKNNFAQIFAPTSRKKTKQKNLQDIEITVDHFGNLLP